MSFFRWFKCFCVLLILVMYTSVATYASTSFTRNEKEVFALAGNLGESSFLLSDILSNHKIMGLRVLDGKIQALQKNAMAQQYFIMNLKLPKNTEILSEKYLKELNNVYTNSTFHHEKFKKAHEAFGDYSMKVSEDISKLYGPKYVWLYDMAFVVAFTNISMSSEYQNKLVMLNFEYLLNYIPYELPVSVISSLSNILTVKDKQLTSTEVDFLKEAAINVISYFNDPEGYTPPVTLKNMVGKWEGRVADPSGVFHKATLDVKPDLSATITVENMFSDMPAKHMALTLNNLTFTIKPFDDDKLAIKFTGKIIDDMMAGEAVDMTGKKGKWQLMKTSKYAFEDIKQIEIENNPSAFDLIEGVWKGRVLEESGSISTATLYINLAGDNRLEIQSGDVEKVIKIRDIAVNNQAVKFKILPDTEKDLSITFVGKLKGRVLEGNAQATDGSRGYWKLIRVAGEKTDNERISWPPKKSLLQYDYRLCDPVLGDKSDDNIIYVAAKKEEKPSEELKEGKYKGYLVFPDATKAFLSLMFHNNGSKIFISDKDSSSQIELDLEDLNITDRIITFKASSEKDKDSQVVFKGRIFGDYISGKAYNSLSEELSWELMAVTKAKSLIKNAKPVDLKNLLGLWEGEAVFSDFLKVPVAFVMAESASNVKIADNKPVEITDITVDKGSISFLVPVYKSIVPSMFVFNGNIIDDKIIGMLTNTEGLGLKLSLKLVQSDTKTDITGIWLGKLYMDKSSADIIFDFTSSEKKVFVDDPKAKSGRVELIVSEFSDKDNVVQFKTRTDKSPFPVNFKGYLKDGQLSGSAQSDMNGARKLSWNLQKSSLTEYIPSEIALITQQDKSKSPEKPFSILDELEEKDNKIQEKKVAVTPQQKEVDAKKKEKIPDKKEKKHINHKNSSEIDQKKEKKSDTDSDKVISDQVDSQKPDNQNKKAEKETSKNPVNDKKKNEITKADPKKESMTSEALVNAGKTKPAIETDQTNLPHENKPENKSKPEKLDESNETNVVLPENFYGEWAGEIVNPDGYNSSVTFDIQEDESYMYVEKNDIKICFKLFDFKIERGDISFLVKPSENVDYGIQFEGNLIQNVLSGRAIDPEGKLGKWFAQKRLPE